MHNSEHLRAVRISGFENNKANMHHLGLVYIRLPVTVELELFR